ncbi:MAG: SDR family oxidoreductase [Ferrovum sp.]|nr:SDR family oxidoreductase [Ferrovum sp.]NDU86774.1 SDR family oxidoreductase [Ferrovum sp.]
MALVTGAGRRLGRAIALGLAQHGWSICVHYHRSQPDALETVAEIRSLGGQAISLQADLSISEQTRALIPQCMAQLGIPHCLINSASLFEYDDALTFRPDLLERHMAIHVTAPMILGAALYQAHTTAPAGTMRGGCIINMLDQKLYNLNPDYLSYTLSKAALNTATQLQALSFAPHLRVVGLAPGITLPSGPQTEAEYRDAHRQTPLGHASFPVDIVHAVCYLATAEAVTGTTLVVDGGQHLQPSLRDVMFTAADVNR